jgi:integrative and conjugative element protein (TIGR02256 family)
MPRQVVFSDRAFTAIMSETFYRMKTETGGVFLGQKRDDTWYIIEAIDPGPRSIFRAAYFEYDQNYINHLTSRIKQLYHEPLELIGLWHRHPGSMDVFRLRTMTQIRNFPD